MAKRSKYLDMPEPPCAVMRQAYKTCLVDRQRWKKAHGLTRKQQERVNVVGPYIADDGRIMEGCIREGVTRAEAERVVRGRANDLSRNRYLIGYRGALAEELTARTRVTREPCRQPRKATGLDLTWWGTPADAFAPGASRKARTLPMLSGVRRR